MANKGFFGTLMFLAAVTIALLSMCCVGSAQSVAVTCDEVLISYLGHTGLHAVEARRSGRFSRISFVCDTDQWDWHNDSQRTPSEYFMSFLHKPSEELRITLTPYDCFIVPKLIASFDSGNKWFTCPALWHLALHSVALGQSSNKLALSAANRFYAELAKSWQTPCLPYAVVLVYDPYPSMTDALRGTIVDITVQHYTELYESKDDDGLLRLAGSEMA
ncbi:hypothetical protein LTR17_024217 [Elasticomyces elasticus]|nr:hypothetical protein LTR17_024217 [Elasticomyces elasticus]